MRIEVEFGGGLEMLFQNRKKIAVELPDIEESENHSLKDLVFELATNHLVGSKALFVESDNELRPGIIVLVNDADCEIFGGMEYDLADGDVVSIISTLHGG